MRDYSVDRAATLERVRPRSICHLLEIVHGSTIRERSFIAERYADFGAHFEDTLRFLEEVGWLRSRNGHVELANEATAAIVATDGLRQSLLFVETVFDFAGPYERLFAAYLCQFRPSDGELVHQPDVEARLRDAGVRDFLMDLGVVTHRPDGDFFVLEEPFAAWALWARNVVSPSANQLAQHAEARLALGLSAELAVIDWERERVGSTHQHRIRHISQENPAACFDIQSVTLVGNDVEPRFIEVKAVAVDSFEFHWSRSEIEAAEILGARYFLYLVPVPAPGMFELARMEIVEDPYREMYRNQSKWSTTVTNVVCRKRESFAS